MSSRPTDLEPNDSKAMRMANKDRMAADQRPMPGIKESENKKENKENKKENKENKKENKKELMDILESHRRETFRKDSVAHCKHHKASVEIGRDNYQRTTSMLSYLSGVEEEEMMTNTYKYVTTSVLWFCYFSLALNDYIFGPTFDDLSQILEVSFETISYFTIIRQVSYTLGALGGFAFNYINRQLTLAALLIISAFTLIATPFSQSINVFYVIGAINGFAAGACDIGFHVWIIEMFEDGGGPLLQALHFSFGIGITIAPSITAAFLSGEGSECEAQAGEQDSRLTKNLTTTLSTSLSTRDPLEPHYTHNEKLYIPYVMSAVIVCSGGVSLLALYIYNKYVPPREPKAPAAFAEEMPKELTSFEKLQLWRQNIPSSYSVCLIGLGSLLLLVYYGLEVTYFQFMAQFVTATPLPIHGAESALVETATGAAYAMGGAISIYLSTRLHPQQMIYFNFAIINIGSVLLIIFYAHSIPMLWIGNVLVGLGFSSTYASASIFLLASGAGTAVLPLFLSHICQSPQSMIIMAFVCTELAAILFLVLHCMTHYRSRQIDMIKKQLIKCPAILLGFRQKSFSILTL